MNNRPRYRRYFNVLFVYFFIVVMRSGCSESFAQKSVNSITTNSPAMIPFQTTDWTNVPVTEHPGESGTSTWKTIQQGTLRIRLVEYSKNYLADHWCSKGHLVYCIEGEMTTELKNGQSFALMPGMMYQVSNDASEHRSMSKNGVKLLIIDGNFLDSSAFTEK